MPSADAELAADIAIAIEDSNRERLIQLGLERFPNLEREIIEQWSDMLLKDIGGSAT